MLTDSEPWSHLKQTFALSVSGPGEISSQNFQVGALSQHSSDPLGPGNSQTLGSTSDPHKHCRRRTFAGNRSTYAPQTGFAPRRTQAATLDPPLSTQIRNVKPLRLHSGAAESSVSSKSSPIAFPDLDLEDVHSQSSCSIPTLTRQNGVSGDERLKDLGSNDIAWDTAQMPRESWLTAAQDNQALHGNFWRNNFSLKSVGGQFPKSSIKLDEISVRGYGRRLQNLAPDDRCSSIYERTSWAQNEHIGSHVHHSAVIMVPTQPTSSEHYDSDRPSSFPITAGFVPPNIDPFPHVQPQAKQVQRRRRDTDSVLRLTSLPMRRKTSNKSTRASRAGSLSTIREVHQALLSVSPTKGRRSGPLSKETREEAAQKRENKSVCIRCHTTKSKCEGEIPCEGCRKNSNARLWAHPCTKYSFLDIVEQETLNAVCKCLGTICARFSKSN